MAGDSTAAAETARPEDGAGEFDAGKAWKDFETAETGAAAAPDKDAAAATAAMAEGASETADLKGADKAEAADKAAEAKDDQATDDKGAAAAKPQDKPAEGANTDKPDIWANATPEAKAAHEAVAKDFDQYKRSNEGRIAALQRQVEALKKGGAAGKPAAADDKPVEKIDPLKLIQDDPDFQQLEKELPEVAGPVGKILARMADRLVQPLENVRAKVTGFETERTEAYLDAQDRYVRDKHDDYDAITKSEDGLKAFTAWYETAPAYLKAGVDRNAKRVVDGHEVADIVSRFKSDTGWKRPASAAADAAASPTADSPPTTPSNAQATPKTDAESVRREVQLKSASQPRTAGGPQVAKPPSDDPKAIWAELDEEERRQGAASR